MIGRNGTGSHYEEPDGEGQALHARNARDGGHNCRARRLRPYHRVWKEVATHQTDLPESQARRLREAKETAPGQA